MLKAFEPEEVRRGASSHGRYLESRAKDREGTLSDEAPKELRRDWYLGEESSGKKVVAAIKLRGPRVSVNGPAVRAHDQGEATRLVKALLAKPEVPQERVALSGRAKWKREGAGL